MKFTKCQRCQRIHRSKASNEKCRKNMREIYLTTYKVENNFPYATGNIINICNQPNNKEQEEMLNEEEENDEDDKEFSYETLRKRIISYKMNNPKTLFKKDLARLFQFTEHLINENKLIKKHIKMMHLKDGFHEEEIRLEQENKRIDFDSFSVKINVECITKICGLRTMLSSSRYKYDLKDKELEFQIISQPLNIFIKNVESEKLKEELTQRGFFCSSHPNELVIKQKYISTSLLTHILIHLNINVVHLAVYGLKEQNIQILKNISIFPSKTNRFDIGRICCSGLSIIKTKDHLHEEIFSVFGFSNFGTSREVDNEVNYKLYSTIIHQIKSFFSFKEPSKLIEKKKVENIFISIKKFMKENIILNTREEISFRTNLNDYEEIVEKGLFLLNQRNILNSPIKKIFWNDLQKMWGPICTFLEDHNFLKSKRKLLTLKDYSFYVILINFIGFSSKKISNFIRKEKAKKNPFLKFIESQWLRLSNEHVDM